MNDYLNEFLNEIFKLENNEQKIILSAFFKTKKGEYGENDKFLGIKVPITRTLVKKYYDKIPLKELFELYKNPYHEIRLAAILMCCLNYSKTKSQDIKKKIYKYYLSNYKYINNWDLVDLTAPNIAGDYSFNNNLESDLTKLSKTDNLWAQRISIVAALYYIRQNYFDYTLKTAKYFFSTKQDLLQKANGWMLREVGKRDEKILKDFLDKNILSMPRTTLRYAIEKFDEKTRKEYLKR